MKAMVLRRPGEEDAFSYEDYPDPQCGPDDVRIRVRSTALNRGDIHRRSGFAGSAPPKPMVVGWDVAGEIDDVGANVGRGRLGQRVVALLVERGGYAELAKAPSTFAVAIPDDMTFDEAAALPVAYLTSWYGLVRKTALHAGEIALVQAGTSGIGVAGIQIAKDLAATVIATAGTDEKVEFCRSLGADHGINYTKEDFVEEVRRKTGGKGVHVVLECVGGETLAKSIEALAPSGRLVSVGNAAMADPPSVGVETLFQVRPRLERESLLAEPDLPWALANMVGMVAQGRIRPVLDRTFPLADVMEAHQYMEARLHKGKVILRP